MTYYRVVHNFDAVEVPEVSVRKGEVVIAVGQAVQNGWIKVVVVPTETGQDSRPSISVSCDEGPFDIRGPRDASCSRKGYVPVSYLEELTSYPAQCSRPLSTSTAFPCHSMSLLTDNSTAHSAQPCRALNGDAETSYITTPPLSTRQLALAPASHSSPDHVSVQSRIASTSPSSSALPHRAGSNLHHVPHTMNPLHQSANVPPPRVASATWGENGRKMNHDGAGSTAIAALSSSCTEAMPRAQSENTDHVHADHVKHARERPEQMATRPGDDSPERCPVPPIRSTSDTVGEFTVDTSVEAFVNSEAQFKQIMQQRADILSSVSATLVNARSDVGACKKGCSELLDQLRSLNEVIGGERSRWVATLQSARNCILRMSDDVTPITDTNPTL